MTALLTDLLAIIRALEACEAAIIDAEDSGADASALKVEHLEIMEDLFERADTEPPRVWRLAVAA